MNELFLRTKPSQLILVHEPETRRFQYGSLAIRELTLRGTRMDMGGETSNEGFTPKANFANLLSDAPSGVVEAQATQDSQINSLASILADIRTIDGAMKKEADRQSSQLDEMHRATDKTLSHMHKTGYRTARLE